MKELVWLVPISLSIAFVLGGCRSETYKGIAREAGKSFLRIILGIALVCLVLQAILWIVPVIS